MNRRVVTADTGHVAIMSYGAVGCVPAVYNVIHVTSSASEPVTSLLFALGHEDKIASITTSVRFQVRGCCARCKQALYKQRFNIRSVLTFTQQ
jgi:hypothetical protein